MELQGRVEELRKAGLGLAAVSYDSREVLAEFAARRAITFPLLSDPGSATIKSYRLLNTTVAADNRAFGVPFPGTFFLDARRRVTSRFFENAYQERSTVTSMLARDGRGGPAQVTTLSTDHLDAHVWAADNELVPGRRTSLVIEVEPRPGMHVYAPGAKGYQVIGLTLESNGFVQTRPVTYPASETYFFAPLDERVPVYRKPFRLVQDIVLDASPAAENALKARDRLILDGTLKYQACDDRICYNPVSLPLSWNFRVKPLDRERAPGR